MAINILYWCLFRSQPFTGTGIYYMIYSWLVCLPSWVGGLLSTGSELVEGISLELSWPGNQNVIFCIVFCYILLRCEMCLVPHANEQQETSNAAGNWCRQWTTTDLVECHPPWPGSCQSWYVLTSITPRHQRRSEKERDCLKALIKTFWIYYYFFPLTQGLSAIVWEGFILCLKFHFSACLQPLISIQAPKSAL